MICAVAVAAKIPCHTTLCTLYDSLEVLCLFENQGKVARGQHKEDSWNYP